MKKKKKKQMNLNNNKNKNFFYNMFDKEIMMYIISGSLDYLQFLVKGFREDKDMFLVALRSKKYEDYYPK